MTKKSEIPIKQLQKLVVMRFADKIYRSCSNCTLSKRRGGECKGKKACIRYTERPRDQTKQMEIDMAAREYQQAIRDYEGACFAQKKSKQRLEEAKDLLLKLTSEGDQND